MRIDNTLGSRPVHRHIAVCRVLAGIALACSLTLGSLAFAQEEPGAEGKSDVDFMVSGLFFDVPDEVEGKVEGDESTPSDPGTPDEGNSDVSSDESDDWQTLDAEPSPDDGEVPPNHRNNEAAANSVNDEDPAEYPDNQQDSGEDDIDIYYLMNGPTNDLFYIDPSVLGSLAVARTPNQIAVGTSLAAIGNPTGDVADLILEFNGLVSPNSQRAALDSLSGEVYGTLQSIGLQIGDRSLRVTSHRLINNRRFLTDSSRMLLSDRSSQVPSDSMNSVVRGQSPAFGAAGWMQGYGVSGGWDSNGNAAGADFRMGGLAYGADLAGDETGVIGLTGGHAFTSFGTDRSDDGHITSHQVGVYLLKNFESVYGLGVLNYGHNRYDVTRLIQVGAINQLVKSNSSGDQWGTYGETGINLDTAFVRFQPFFGLQYLSLTNGSVFEGGGGGIGLNVGGSNVSTLQSHLGTRLILEVWHPERRTVLRPYFNARWVAELLGDNHSAVASLNGGPAGAGWVVTGNHSGRHLGVIGPGLTAQLTEQISLFANYDFQFGNGFHSSTGSGGMLFEF